MPTICGPLPLEWGPVSGFETMELRIPLGVQGLGERGGLSLGHGSNGGLLRAFQQFCKFNAASNATCAHTVGGSPLPSEFARTA